MATGMTLYFRMPFPEDNVLFELMYSGKPGLLGIQVHLHRSSIYDAVHRVFIVLSGCTFLLRKFAGRTSPGDYHVTPTHVSATTSI